MITKSATRVVLVWCVCCLFHPRALAQETRQTSKELNREEFTTMFRALFVSLRDVEFRFEGQSRRLTAPDFSKAHPALRVANERTASKDIGVVHQGTVAYRSDFAVHLDVYKQPLNMIDPVVRDIWCLLRRKFTRRRLIADRGGAVAPDETTQGNTGLFLRDSSPFLAFQFADLLQILSSETSFDYRFIRWDFLDSRRCAIIELFMTNPDTRKEVLVNRYWIDVERGGHPAKIERRADDRLVMAVEVQDFAHFAVDETGEETLWFPTKAIVRSYSPEDGGVLGELLRTPNYEKSFQLLRGTFKANQGLTDARFSPDYGLDTLTQTNVKKLASQPTKRRGIRSQDESPEVLHRKAAAEAAEHPDLYVSVPSQESWLGLHAFHVGFGVAGVLTLLVAAVLKRRYA